ncbi:MAG: arginine--tRNA ligase [Bacteroidota bacterium]|nr:arginine--tRNA ligase [Bacteroidota bacterium]
MDIQEVLKKRAAEALKTLYSAEVPQKEIQLQETRKDFTGDFTVVIFPLTKYSNTNPQETAEYIGRYLDENVPEVIGFEVVKGFLNLALSTGFWAGALNAIALKKAGVWDMVSAPQRIMVEYSSPNTNKPLHLGHIRNNLLGYSVAEILKARGHDVIKASLFNDKGIHISKSMLAWMKFGNAETPESSGLKGDHLAGKYYVLFDRELKKQVETLVAKGEVKEQAEKQAPLLEEAQELYRSWEQGDPHTLATWKMMNNWVYNGFEKTYKSLGVNFDLYQYESETYLYGKEIVKEGLDRNVFYKKEDGSVAIDLSGEGLDEKALMRKDGTSIYITQDIGTAQERFDKYNLDKLIYVVANEQDYHFKALQLIFKKLGRPWWNSIYHLSYGMVDLPSGKMKSREGTVVDADDLISEMIETAAEETRKLGKIEGLSEDEQKALFTRIGMAALKFYILRADPRKKMLFNPADSIDIQGFTGPFVQYTHARIRSILRKQNETEFTMSITGLTGYEMASEERELVRLIYLKDDKLMEAEKELSPAVIANYAYDLAKTYNKFYHICQVLNEPDPDIRNFRLCLSQQVGRLIKASFHLLGIEVPEKM